jgi:hypothetical protein
MVHVQLLFVVGTLHARSFDPKVVEWYRAQRALCDLLRGRRINEIGPLVTDDSIAKTFVLGEVLTSREKPCTLSIPFRASALCLYS